jgi:hypothetical protein
MADIFSLEAVKVNIGYLDQLKKLFTHWIHQNQMGKITVNWKDVEDKNLTMIARSFMQLCRYNSLTPHLFNPELLE